jgi:hypothetical protein
MRELLRLILFKIGWKIVKKTCLHEHKRITFEDYPDRCTHYWCNDCNSIIYKSMD